ncbi:DUF1285 domain-containing protein [Sansalvadorimonas verongulae]|uniref:DUF1285 domain-containing protein n=1 Tax=Sansalvadorimonas verongulae TaxID=2172824 RepID=UPI0038B65E87
MSEKNDRTGDLLEQVAEASKKNALPPVHKWNPPFCGDSDMVIKRDGSWHYMNSPIGRERMVRLFSTVLRKDDDDYFLVTPVEKVGITVEDVPFIAISVERVEEDGKSALRFMTNVGDSVIASTDNPLRVELAPGTEEPAPYILVRKGLEARLHRNVFYQLVDMAEIRSMGEREWYGVESGGVFFQIAPVSR